ncbi:hypothetical protein CSAL01_02218 [Colletotrichum salicis]|uniref:Uncharacterized protein n=1 Tax=Colletotrichum salicis TaxID=1209931 RepID=A0A135V7S4_9PEZI|nr:hypothetical protein CSAL01_02218 [Colletotrichum salicis]
MEVRTEAKSPDRSGLRWVRNNLDYLEPRWIINPDMAAILETAKSTLGIQGSCSIEFLADGTFNKLYVVESAGQEIVVRVTLPIEPRLKTLSEIATLGWDRQNTSLTVPDILAYTADRAYLIGFEWIIVNKVPGEPLADVWKEIPYSAKEQLVRRIALFFSETFEHQMRAIGNIFPNVPSSQTSTSSKLDAAGIFFALSHISVAADFPSQRPHENCEQCGQGDDLFAEVETSSAPSFTVQRLVSYSFIGEHSHSKLSYGPFASSKEWMSARLDFVELDCSIRLRRFRNSDQRYQPGENNTKDDNRIRATTKEDDAKDEIERTVAEEHTNENGEDDDDVEFLEAAMILMTRLRNHLKDAFPSTGLDPESTVIFHDNMDSRNILVDKVGNLTAVVDWGCVSVLPLWMACQYPPFL